MEGIPLAEKKQTLKPRKLEVDCFKGESAFGSMVLHSVASGTRFRPLPGPSSGAVGPPADHSPSLTQASQRGELIPASSDIPVAHLVPPGDATLGCL